MHEDSVVYDFDQIIDRRLGDSAKWNAYPSDLLPLWVADMDFLSPLPVIKALQDRVSHGVFGYGLEPPELREVVREHLSRRYDWPVENDHFVTLPGTVVGLNLACAAVGDTGDDVLIQSPIYPPFLSAPANANRNVICDPLVLTARGYEIDFEAFERAITPRTRLFMLCNPHNPCGRVFTRHELERLAEICLRRDIIVCSDEIHYGFVYGGHEHVPFATLGPEIAARTITLIAPSKTYNIPGLHFSLALIGDHALRHQFIAAGRGTVESTRNLFGYVAALAAYREGDNWLRQLLAYLQANRDFVVDFVARKLPDVGVTVPEGTYLAWLDFRRVDITEDPSKFLLREAKVVLNKGPLFGPGGEGFARLNFGCPRSILVEALNRIALALARKPVTDLR